MVSLDNRSILNTYSVPTNAPKHLLIIPLFPQETPQPLEEISSHPLWCQSLGPQSCMLKHSKAQWQTHSTLQDISNFWEKHKNIYLNTGWTTNSMKPNREPINRPTRIFPPNFWEWHKNFIDIYIIYNVLISAAQPCDSVIHIIFHFLFHYSLSQDTEYSSLSYTKSFLTNGVGTEYVWAKTEPWPKPHTLHKNQLKADHGLTCKT